MQTNKQTVAVYGAAGHTGQFVVRELQRRGLTPIAVGRDASKLAAAGFAQTGVECREASAENADALDHAFAGAAVINCAGPFLDTAEVIASSTLRTGLHYFDVTAEQASAQFILDDFSSDARKAGLLMVPAMGFFGGFADLLAATAMGDWTSVDGIQIRIALDSWLPTSGTRKTGARNTAPRQIVSGGELRRLPDPSPEHTWAFPPPFGSMTFVELPFSEVVLIRHRRPKEVHTYLNAGALRDVQDASTPGPKPIDAEGRSAQRFAVEVTVTRDGVVRRALGQGQDIYAFSAPLVCEAVQRTLGGRFGDVGAHAPAAAFEAADLLRSLTPRHLQLEVY